MTHWHSTVDIVLQNFGVESVKAGLSSAQVEAAREKYGKNAIPQKPAKPLWKLVLEQFEDALVLILLGAAVLSFVLACFEEKHEDESLLAKFVEPIVILTILILNAIVGVLQEKNAEDALENLKELQGKFALVIRNNQPAVRIDAEELVPGDIIELYDGDRVPADARVVALRSTILKVEEGSLTGESTTTNKNELIIPENIDAHSASDKTNMIFSSTTVTQGKCIAVVTETGSRTNIGEIAASLQDDDEDDEKTPLGKKIDQFGNMLTWAISFICLLVWVMNVNNFWDPMHGDIVDDVQVPNPIKGCIYYLKIAVALGVAAIPEGLPAVITLCLSLGTKKMADRNAIVRKLPSVETLGCTTVICSDKTGTLTTNKMVVKVVMTYGNNGELKKTFVPGTSYNPNDLSEKRGGSPEAPPKLNIDDKNLARCLVLCNNSRVVEKEDNDGLITYERFGEPTEAAMKVVAQKLGVADAAAVKTVDTPFLGFKRISELEFDRQRKSMSVIAHPIASEDQSNVLFAKGATEMVIDRCSRVELGDGRVIQLTDTMRKTLLDEAEKLAMTPLRCLAMAYKDLSGDKYLATYDGSRDHAGHKYLEKANKAEIESDMVYCGMVGIKDPARPQVPDSIRQCQEAHIRVIVITGDKKETAMAICSEIGVFDKSMTKHEKDERSFLGKDFMDMADTMTTENGEEKKVISQKQKDVLARGGNFLFARTKPEDKKFIVRVLKENQDIAAMTGDGVNDAPALKAAHIGIAMGISGTEVAKDASDLILADDDFATIVAAVEEGRSIYSNMKAFIRYLISSNIGEVVSVFLTAMLGLPEGLVPVQLLWVNLVTDGPPATALGFNPADPEIMRQPPRSKDEKLIGSWVFFRYMVVGIYVGWATVFVFAYWYIYDDNSPHTPISWEQLSNFAKCMPGTGGKFLDGVAPDLPPIDTKFCTFYNMGETCIQGIAEDPCYYMKNAKDVASTLSLSVLVTIEMFNALNALSEDSSLLVVHPFVNLYLLGAMAISFGLHFVILYIPALADIFNIVPLTLQDWVIVFLFSFPVILIDEVLKFVGRQINRK